MLMQLQKAIVRGKEYILKKKGGHWLSSKSQKWMIAKQFPGWRRTTSMWIQRVHLSLVTLKDRNIRLHHSETRYCGPAKLRKTGGENYGDRMEELMRQMCERQFYSLGTFTEERHRWAAAGGAAFKAKLLVISIVFKTLHPSATNNFYIYSCYRLQLLLSLWK